MRKLLIVSILIFSMLNIYAEKFSSEVELLTNEKWYGAHTAKAWNNTPLKDIQFQPFENNTSRKDLYDNLGNQSAPLLISNMGRYIWSNEPFAFEFKDGSLMLYSDTEKMEAVLAGKTLRDAYVAAKDKFFPASGKTPNPLMFKMPQYNTWIELGNNQNQKDILKYAENVLKNGFPTGVFMIDDIWSNYYGNFEFNPTTFPNPKEMIDTLHSKGFKVMLWLTPFVSADSKEFRELKRQKLLVLKKDANRVALIQWWNGFSACMDLTKPKAVDWLRNKLKKLQLEYGVDGFKFDAADFLFYKNGAKTYFNEDTNTKGQLQAEMYAKLGAEYDFNEFRACWKNGNQPLAQRLQDKSFSWDELKLLIPDMVSAGLIGHPFTCPDMIGGGLIETFVKIDLTKFDQEMMIRSAQIQALMPMMQFSVAPWRVLDEKHLAIVREAALLHAKMGEYIYELALKAAGDGEPIVRHMEYEFPNQGFESCNDQYMLGDKYLIAPMVEKGEIRSVKLPKGKWMDDSGRKYKGGQTVKIIVPINRLPYFIRHK